LIHIYKWKVLNFEWNQTIKVETLTLEVLAEKLLSEFDSKRFVEWAVDVLKTGTVSENLYILAGLDYESTEEREEYFWKAVADLNLNISKSKDELIEIYAINLAKKVIVNKIDIEHAFNKMVHIVSASDYSSQYIAFYEISEDLDYIKYDNSVLYNSGLTLENYKTFILEEFKIFLEMENLKIPLEERIKSLCLNCNKLTKPVLKKKYQLKIPIKYNAWCCQFCGSKNLEWKSNQSVKHLIIKKFKEKLTNNPIL
jgi:hypothetical protein